MINVKRWLKVIEESKKVNYVNGIADISVGDENTYLETSYREVRDIDEAVSSILDEIDNNSRLAIVKSEFDETKFSYDCYEVEIYDTLLGDASNDNKIKHNEYKRNKEAIGKLLHENFMVMVHQPAGNRMITYRIHENKICKKEIITVDDNNINTEILKLLASASHSDKIFDFVFTMKDILKERINENIIRTILRFIPRYIDG